MPASEDKTLQWPDSHKRCCIHCLNFVSGRLVPSQWLARWTISCDMYRLWLNISRVWMSSRLSLLFLPSFLHASESRPLTTTHILLLPSRLCICAESRSEITFSWSCLSFSPCFDRCPSVSIDPLVNEDFQVTAPEFLTRLPRLPPYSCEFVHDQSRASFLSYFFFRSLY